MIHPVAHTRNGVLVNVDLIESFAALQIAQQPYLLTLAGSLLSDCKVNGQHVWIERDMGHDIGVCDVVETSDKDTIIYAQQAKSQIFVPFVKNRKMERTSFISLELLLNDDQSYSLHQIIFGHPVPSFPYSNTESADSRDFWTSHALLWGDWPIQSKTITKDCPWDNAVVI